MAYSVFVVPRIYLAVFDMAATTVDDIISRPGLEEKLPLVISAYETALEKAGIRLSFDELNLCRGKDKIEIFREKVAKYRTDLSGEEQQKLAQNLHDNEFVPALLENVQYLKEMPGTSETFDYLQKRGVYVATGSGFPSVVTDAINEKLGWKKRRLVNFATCGEKAGGGRPKPNMINQALVEAQLLPRETDLSKRVEGFGYSVVLKVGDTLEDIHEGNNVGATTVAVSSGTQGVEMLLQGQPKVILPSIAALPNYLDNHGYFR